MCIQKLIISTIALLWLGAISMGADTGMSSLAEHSEAVMSAQWWIIGGLFAIIQILILTFYAYSQQASSRAMRTLLETMKGLQEKQDKKEELLLDTRKILLELHGEHKVMMDRCHQVQQQRYYKPSREDEREG